MYLPTWNVVYIDHMTAIQYPVYSSPFYLHFLSSSLSGFEDGNYYTHLGAAASPEALRKMLEER